MTINILAFGIAKDIVNGSSVSLNIKDGATVQELKDNLCDQYPDFKKLKALSIAVNTEYQQDDFVLSEQDEVVIIPPVSGG